ncbi:MAG: bifunctional folylpolyglutamate synthase/dihydrofolate synthase [Chloroflexi bacterium]|nr:MAG: bifunctional folylpolyglutamate synthase/dihydrofolate synthase [Chloroflexota bacterium]
MACLDAATVRALVRQLPDYEVAGGSPFAGAEAGLRRTAKLLDLLGRPDIRYLVAQVAGTNGKGSTAAMIASILEAAGARTGLYTSPHLARWEERIRISGEVVDDDMLARAGALVLDAALQLSPDDGELTRFEFWTALACVSFGLSSCRAAVLEVGLGGRYDATTAARVDLAVITRIGLDHTAILGASIPAIAREKAAIIRERMPTVSAPQVHAARDVIVATAGEAAAPLLLGGRDFNWRRTPEGLDVMVLEQTYAGLRLPLRGAYQEENAATAVTAALALGTLGIKLNPEMVSAGIAATRWPGRFEVIDHIVLDGAHNPDGARALAAALRGEFPGERFSFVLGTMRDKDLTGMLQELVSLAVKVIAVRSASPRARPAEDVASSARQLGLAAVVAESVSAALSRRSDTDRTVVCGSLAVVAEARAALGLSD